MGLRYEQRYPYVFGVLVGAVIYVAENYGIKPPSAETMLSALVSLGGIFVAFLAATRSILLSLPADTKEALKNSEYNKDLKHYLLSAQWSALLLCLTAVAGFTPELRTCQIYIPILLGILVIALSCLHRLSRIATNLLLS